jgi:SAM-dependent methyltransferase
VFDYKSSTREAYKSRPVARAYHEAFAHHKGLKTLRFRIVAAAERVTVFKLLRRLRFERVLDIPCGTGKLASIFRDEAVAITAADISPEMLELAEQTYETAGVHNVRFAVADVERLTSQFAKATFDVVVCLRLMHRVPHETRLKMLEQIATVARYAIISFGVDSVFLRIRRWTRNLLLGGGNEKLCTAKYGDLQREVETHFTIRDARWIIPLVSEEVVFLLERK